MLPSSPTRIIREWQGGKADIHEQTRIGILFTLARSCGILAPFSEPHPRLPLPCRELDERKIEVTVSSSASLARLISRFMAPLILCPLLLGDAPPPLANNDTTYVALRAA